MSPKIFVITVPQAGHLNPLFGILTKLSESGFKVVVYSTRKFQQKIEQANVEFRSIDGMSGDILLTKNVPLLELIPFMDEQMIKIFDNNSMGMLQAILNEQPDLILYDIMALYAKWTIKFLDHYQSDLDGLSKFVQLPANAPIKIPKTASYCTSFLSLAGVYPNDFEKTIKYQCSDEGRARAKVDSDRVAIQMTSLTEKYKFNFSDHMSEAFDPNCLNIVFTFTEFQPHYQQYDLSRTKFIGSCIDENLRLNGVDKNFDEIDKLLAQIGSRRLVYASFGTVFCHPLCLYISLLEAFNSNDLENENIFVVMSAGSNIFNELNKLIDNGQIKIGENIKLVQSIAQLRMLQHASLFLTHCGFNSISEAIHFGVPMICLPISAEQPINALYIANDLKLGLELNVNALTVDDVVKSVKTILNDSSYKERCLQYSKLSRKYNGSENAVIELTKYLNESD